MPGRTVHPPAYRGHLLLPSRNPSLCSGQVPRTPLLRLLDGDVPPSLQPQPTANLLPSGLSWASLPPEDKLRPSLGAADPSAGRRCRRHPGPDAPRRRCRSPNVSRGQLQPRGHRRERPDPGSAAPTPPAAQPPAPGPHLRRLRLRGAELRSRRKGTEEAAGASAAPAPRGALRLTRGPPGSGSRPAEVPGQQKFPPAQPTAPAAPARVQTVPAPQRDVPLFHTGLSVLLLRP